MDFLSSTGIGEDVEDNGDIIMNAAHYWPGNPQEKEGTESMMNPHETDTGMVYNTHTQRIQPEEEEEEVNEEEEDAAHKCSYCGHADACSVVQCGAVSCKKWFCNSRGRRAGAHIISHMIRARHKEITLHPDGLLGDTTIECFVCGRRNIFVLGFVPSKADSVVILLCREPCLSSPQIGDTEWDSATWLPLIEDRQLLPWLVRVPEKEETERSRNITQKQMQQLEDLWKTTPEGTVEDLALLDQNDEPSAVMLSYEDAYQYEAIYKPLLNLEATCSQALKAQVAKENLTIQWTQSKNTKLQGKLSFACEDSGADPMIGEELIISHPQMADKKVIGIIIEANPTTQADECLVELVNGEGVPREVQHGYTVQLVWQKVTFDRMKAALQLFAKSETSLTTHLYHRILGHDVEAPTFNIELPNNITAPGLPVLNPSQAAAVRGALLKPLSLIQGPPGTGKTVTAATLVYQMCRINQSQILVTAPSNVAVDHLVERIQLTGLKVVRVCARNRESLASSVNHLSLHYMVQQYAEKKVEWGSLRKLMQLRNETGGLKLRDETLYLKLMQAVENEIISNADIVCTTCVAAGSRRLQGFRFKHVVIDESTQACEPETLIPLVRGCRQAVLIGDHRQLGPVIMARSAVRAGLARSLFERLVILGARPYRLRIQYRMHPAIAEFPSNTFYEGTLQNGVTHYDRLMREHYFPWPQEDRPMFFYNSQGQEEISGSGTSYLNRTEAALVEHCVTQFLRGGVTPDHIGVITPYKGQSIYTSNYLVRNGTMPAELYRRIEIFSVDAFQGREKQYIIFSCVRSNMNLGIGFLSDARRLNVALTRAQCGLVIIGNARVLARDPLWHALLSHFKDKNLIVEGPLQTLRVVNVALPKPWAPLTHPGDSQAPNEPIPLAGDDQVEASAKSVNVVNTGGIGVPAQLNGSNGAPPRNFLRAAQQYLEHTPGAADYYSKVQQHNAYNW